MKKIHKNLKHDKVLRCEAGSLGQLKFSDATSN